MKSRLSSPLRHKGREMLENEPINSTTLYPHHAVWTRVGEGEGGGLGGGSIYGERKPKGNTVNLEKGQTVLSRRFRKLQRHRGQGREEKSTKEDMKERLMWTYTADA